MKNQNILDIVNSLPEDLMRAKLNEDESSLAIEIYLNRVKDESYQLLLTLFVNILKQSNDYIPVFVEFLLYKNIEFLNKTFSLDVWKNYSTNEKISWLDSFLSISMGSANRIILLILSADFKVSNNEKLISELYGVILKTIYYIDSKTHFDLILKDLNLVSTIKRETGVVIPEPITTKLFELIFVYGDASSIKKFLNQDSINKNFSDVDLVYKVFAKMISNGCSENNLLNFQYFLSKNYSRKESGSGLLERDFNLIMFQIYLLSGDSRSILKFVDKESLRKFLIHYDHMFYFLHKTIKTNNIGKFIFLKSLMREKFNSVDQDGNTLLHLCSNELNWLKLIYDFEFKNKDIKNNAGCTALHLSAMEDQIEKVQFLLKNGADENIKNSKGLKFYEVALLREEENSGTSRKHNVGMYCYYYCAIKLSLIAGKCVVLTPILNVYTQQGPNCGYFAVANARDHLFNNWKNQFSKVLLPPLKRTVDERKGWYEDNVNSLRALRNTYLNIGGIGEIFSAAELSRVLNEAECNSAVCSVKTYEQFIFIIKIALEKNLPVIIPFSLIQPSEIPDPKGNSQNAHWATIVGLVETGKNDELLLVQYGQYFRYFAHSLYLSNKNLSDFFSGKTYTKNEITKKWKVEEKLHKQGEKNDIKRHEVKAVSLEDFRQKLVIAMPKHITADQLGLENIEISEYRVPSPASLNKN